MGIFFLGAGRDCVREGGEAGSTARGDSVTVAQPPEAGMAAAATSPVLVWVRNSRRLTALLREPADMQCTPGGTEIVYATGVRIIRLLGPGASAEM